MASDVLKRSICRRCGQANTVGFVMLIVVFLLSGWPGAGMAQQARAPKTERGGTALHPVLLTTFKGLIEPADMDGGAIEPLGDGFVLVDGDGAFYHLEWDSDGVVLRSKRLPLTAPLHRAAYLQDHQGERRAPRLRATDFVIDTFSKPQRVFVAHQHWNPQQRCYTIQVSVAPFSLAGTHEAPTPWQTVFETRPCLSASDGFDDIETGGRLAWNGQNSLLLTVGDHGFSGKRPISQDPEGHYGKILSLDLDGGGEIFSIGHRNPQGLEIARDGQIWSTEHGPQGGDEINLIKRGSNYGWPFASYGTQYGLEYWPFGTEGRDHGRFVEPVSAFVPSLAISNLIQVGADQFPGWDGDFLIGTLSRKLLYRMRTRGSRVSYMEPIWIGHRIRDLAEGSDGRIVLWTGKRDVLVLSRAKPSKGEQAYVACAECHGADLEGTPLGPSLRHVWDRPIATRPEFKYSPALEGLGGSWNDQKLDAFIQDPQAFAPGTAMTFPGIPDPRVRRALIAYLHKNL